jgi:hypothetical protein
MTEVKKPSEESCADFVDRIQLEALNQRWASVVVHGRSRQRGIQTPEIRPAQLASPDREIRADPPA